MLSRLLLLSTLFVAVISSLGLAACDGSDYHHDGSQWAHGDARFTPQHPASFEPLDQVFARDKLRGYCRGSEIEGSDGASFVVVSETEALDRNNVYRCDTYRNAQEYWSIQHLRIERIDGATYVSLGKGYARDKHRVYMIGKPFQVRDPASFEPLDGDFGRDSQRGYYARVEIPGSHGPSFETIDARDTAYARDRANGYFGYRDQDVPGTDGTPRRIVRTLRTAEPAMLRVLGRDYAADTRHVWHAGQKVAGADAATFAVDDSGQEAADSRDKSGAWNAGRRVGASQ